MGIRFYCPNGHKMNVKNYQAGLKGFCPVCGEKVQIPLKSTRPSSRRERNAEAADVQPQAPAESIEQPVEAVQEMEPSSAATVFDGSPEANPLDAANLVWYIHTPAGQQLGPVLPPVVQEWLGAGKITADCLVWREGWAEWQMAGAVFPQLSTMPSEAELEIIPHHAVMAALHGQQHAAHAPPRRAQLIAFGTLAAIIAIIAIAGFVIWMIR